MKYIFLSVIMLLTGAFSCLAQKKHPYSATKEPPITTHAPPVVLPVQQTGDTGAVRMAEKQAVSGFNITQFVATNFHYPSAVLNDSNFVSVRIMTEFIVEKDAGISSVKIVKFTNTGGTYLLPDTERLLKQEVVRVIRKMPRWQSPAYQDGKPVRSYFNLPIHLRSE